MSVGNIYFAQYARDGNPSSFSELSPPSQAYIPKGMRSKRYLIPEAELLAFFDKSDRDAWAAYSKDIRPIGKAEAVRRYKLRNRIPHEIARKAWLSRPVSDAQLDAIEKEGEDWLKNSPASSRELEIAHEFVRRTLPTLREAFGDETWQQVKRTAQLRERKLEDGRVRRPSLGRGKRRGF